MSTEEQAKSSETTSGTKEGDFTSVVAQHYNQLEEKGLEERARSRIFHMRNFNNWVKSMLINEFLNKVKGSSSEGREREGERKSDNREGEKRSDNREGEKRSDNRAERNDKREGRSDNRDGERSREGDRRSDNRDGDRRSDNRDGDKRSDNREGRTDNRDGDRRSDNREGRSDNRDGDRRSDKRKAITVLDIGSGKGGDLLKWKKGDIHHLVCADIAATSLEQCQQRYEDMVNRDRRSRHSCFTLECVPADCTKVRLKDLYKEPSIQFDLVSCQFSFHYCFESLEQAQCMLRNASESLKPGGFFIGTTPDAFDLVRRLRESESLSFGNDIFSATFESKDEIPLFGARYMFHLEGVVDCPEFLVYFPAMVELASKFGLKLLCRQRFEDFYQEHIKHHDGRSLLTAMKALQTYPEQSESGQPPPDEAELKKEFKHAESYLEEHHPKDKEDDRWPPRLGTLSQSEWEALSIYIVYAFVKEGDITDEQDN